MHVQGADASPKRRHPAEWNATQLRHDARHPRSRVLREKMGERATWVYLYGKVASFPFSDAVSVHTSDTNHLRFRSLLWGQEAPPVRYMPSQSLPAWAVLGVEAVRLGKEVLYPQPSCAPLHPAEDRALQCPAVEWPVQACPAVTCPGLSCPPCPACPDISFSGPGFAGYIAGGAVTQGVVWAISWAIQKCRNGARRSSTAPSRRGGGVLA